MKPLLIIVGLGNPGTAYENTRHNAGFRGVDILARHSGGGDWKDMQKWQAQICEGRVSAAPTLFVKPQTYMNASGESVKKIVEFYKLSPAEQLLILCDDVDIARGTLRLRKSGSAGTHNGLKSIIDHFGESVPRLRIGIGPQPEGVDLAAWVLSSPPDNENNDTEKSLQELPKLIEDFVLGITDTTISKTSPMED